MGKLLACRKKDNGQKSIYKISVGKVQNGMGNCPFPPPPGCAIAGRADGVRVRGFRTI